ncbi:MAG: hypothetical protein WAV30_00435 [Microgenomates group bacterium]
MHENPRYDLRKVENWTKNNAPNVALQLGYVLNKRFIHAVELYGKKLRKSHEEGGIVIYDYLPIFGNRFLKEYKPPLKRA